MKTWNFIADVIISRFLWDEQHSAKKINFFTDSWPHWRNDFSFLLLLFFRFLGQKMSGVTRGIKLVVIGDGAVGKTWYFPWNI